jgi:multiple sugar transport system ATP-binding protein
VGQIDLDNVTKEFAGGVVAVDHVSLTIEDGEFMVLVGPSGCGKTTLLRTIGGLEDVTGGRIRIGERDVTRMAPARRDIAMVFQNYALYPHMTVRKNLGYGLRVRRAPRKEIEQRVQRVAMGRAIIREPAAFLMDEPLSNLDAKLRVGMRTSLQQLHARLGTTTVYVTHDQVEAMTLGQRVAVMRDGRIQQVDVPQRLYEDPTNVFVAGFIGSPAMNLAEATVRDGSIMLGSTELPLDRDRRPPTGDGKVVVGIRPEAFEDAAFAPGDLPQLEARASIVEELGSDGFLFFDLDAQPIVIEEAVSATDEETSLLADTDRGLFAARVDPRTEARVGETVRLAVDPSRFHFFALDSGKSLLSQQAVAA